MKRTVYMAPAINITTIHTQPLLKIGSVTGDTDIEPGGPDDGTNEPEARPRHSVWDDEEEEQD